MNTLEQLSIRYTFWNAKDNGTNFIYIPYSHQYTSNELFKDLFEAFYGDAIRSDMYKQFEIWHTYGDQIDETYRYDDNVNIILGDNCFHIVGMYTNVSWYNDFIVMQKHN